jgi:hypothetical protein
MTNEEQRQRIQQIPPEGSPSSTAGEVISQTTKFSSIAALRSISTVS